MRADVDQKSCGLKVRPMDRSGVPLSGVGASIVRSRLFFKYMLLFVMVVVVALVANGLFEVLFSYQEHKGSLIGIQEQQAVAAADKIEEFITQIESQVGWTTQLPLTDGTLDQRRFDAWRLLLQVPAITELAQIDAAGHEQLKVSRLTMVVVGSGVDYSQKPEFTQAVAHKMYYGPVYFRRESEPYMTLSLAGTRRDTGVSIAQINLKLIWDVVSKIKVGEHGGAYVIDSAGRLIAHPDISLVLRNTDMSRLAQVRGARAGTATEAVQEADDIGGHKVLTAYAPVNPPGWFVFVETPVEEAYAPLYRSILRTGYVLLGALALALIAGMFLAGRMMVPIQALRAGAARIGGGDLGQRILIKSGDEIEALANQFNDMAGKLQESYAGLEMKVEQRTAELSESLEQQTATSEVLKVISSSPGDLEPVFEAILSNATRLCDAKFGTLWLAKDDGFQVAATHRLPPTYGEQMQPGFAIHPGPTVPITRAVSARETVHITDLRQDVAYLRNEPVPRDGVKLGGIRTLMLVPMLREREVPGVFAIYRQEVRPFTDKQIALVQNFTNQAVIAIENARLLRELNREREALARQHQADARNISWLRQLAGFLRHEVRQPVAQINSSVELIHLTSHDDQLKPYIASASQGVRDIWNLIERASRVTDAETFVRQGQPQPVDLPGLLRELIGSYQQTHSGIDFRLQLPDKEPLYVSADPTLLKEAVSNLLANAASFADEESIIQVVLERDGVHAVIKVRNKGPIIQYDTEMLFGPFASTRSGPSSEHQGLGLYLVRLVAEHHGGKAIISNLDDGSGVEASIFLPL
jgi:signal transduction histidine kinase/HAMP domain-containing protein